MIRKGKTFKSQVFDTDWEHKIVNIELYWGEDNSVDYEMLNRLRLKNIPLTEKQFNLINRRFEAIEQRLHVKFDLLSQANNSILSLKPNIRIFKKSY